MSDKVVCRTAPATQGLLKPLIRGWYTFQKVKVDLIIEQIPIGGYIISTLA